MAETVRVLLRDARNALAEAGLEPAGREARLLLGHVLELGEAAILAHPERQVPVAAAARFGALLERRLGGEPVAYLFGEREFYGRPFAVDRRVLIPRPETEHLVTAALALELPATPRILDVGTGSGCIAVTLALELPRARLVATDVSLDALQVLRRNVERHHVGARVAGVRADLTAALRLERLDLVVSNPPYIDAEVMAELAPAVRDFEPRAALVAADAGRALLATLVDSARALRSGTHLLLEIGYDQAHWLQQTVAQGSELELLDIVRDYAGIARTAVVRRR